MNKEDTEDACLNCRHCYDCHKGIEVTCSKREHFEKWTPEFIDKIRHYHYPCNHCSCEKFLRE